MTAIETIPIPTDRTSEGLPFDVRVSDLTAWPDQQIHFQFEYNDLMDRWVFKADHTEGSRLIEKSVATLGQQYSAWPYVLFEFRDTTGKHDQITQHVLGDDVILAVFPGPAGGSFLPEADISQEREDIILNRHEFYPHRGRRTGVQIPSSEFEDN